MPSRFDSQLKIEIDELLLSSQELCTLKVSILRSKVVEPLTQNKQTSCMLSQNKTGLYNRYINMAASWIRADKIIKEKKKHILPVSDRGKENLNFKFETLG